eukprot:scaffold2825_cov97-Skeletonema_dohrnii-CCMP3373.AAC.1
MQSDRLSPQHRTNAAARASGGKTMPTTPSKIDHLTNPASHASNGKTMPTTPSVILSPQHRTNAAARSSGGGNLSNYDEFSSIWLQSFLTFEQQENESSARKDLSNFIELPGHLVHPHAQRHLKRINKTKSPKKNHERRHIKEMRKTLLGGTKQQSKQQTVQKSMEGPLPYVEANTKISRVLKHMKLKTNKEDMQASRLDEFYKLVARETAAAIVLQSSCRRVLATACVRQLALETAQATKIQCFVRQFIARRVLQELQCAKRRATLIILRTIHLHVARCRRRKQIKLEHNAAIICQSTVRMHFAKRLLLSMKLQHSWEVNQTRWKTLSLRLAFADMRINFYARQIQCIVRRRLAQKRVASMHAEHSKAALKIQCCWRRFDAQLRNHDLLYERSVEQHCNKIRIINSEHNYWTQKVEDLKIPAKLQIKASTELQHANLMEERRQKYEEIHALETRFEDQFNLLQQISPQEVEGGWEEQVKLRSVERKLDDILSNEKGAADSMNHWGKWRQAEQDALWNFQRQHDDKVAEKEKRKSIVDEQLRWAVKFYVASGKPDKRRPLVIDSDSVSNIRIEELTAAAALQMNKIQEINHLSRTWTPFQRMMDQFNQGTIFDGLTQNRDTRLYSHEEAMHPTLISQSKSYMAGAKLEPFPQKLPWHLLKEVRDEQKEIEVFDDEDSLPEAALTIVHSNT